MEKKIVNSYIGFVFIYRFFFSFVFAIYVLFLKENNLSFTEIGIVNTVFMIGVFVLEIPTGAIADYFGRKFSVVLGACVSSVAMMIYFLSNSLWGFILAEFSMALAAALMSGALEAWVKTSLNLNGSKLKSAVIFSKAEKASKVALILGGAIGAAIGVYDMRLTWLVASIGVLFSALFAVKAFDEKYFVRRKLKSKEWFAHMKLTIHDSIKYGLKHANICRLMVVGFFVMLGVQAFNMQWSPFFEGSIGLWSIGYIWVAIQFALLGGVFAVDYMVKKKVPENKMILMSIVIIFVMALLASNFENGWIVVLFFLVHEIGRGGFVPLEKAYLQDNIEVDSKRATIASFHGMALKLGAGIGWMGSGILADVLQVQSVWMISSVCFFIAIIVAWKLK